MLSKAVKRLGIFGTRHFGKYMTELKEHVSKSNLNMLVDIYVGKMMLGAIIIFLLSATTGFVLFFYFLDIALLLSAAMSVFIGIGMAIMALVAFYLYPFHIISMKKRSIEVNMPFAINHMSAIAISGIPPVAIFRLLSNISEYGEVSNESKRIIRNMDVFGMDVTAAIKNVAERTPSPEFRQFLFSILSTINTGGDLAKLLKNSASEALFDYRIKRQKYIQTLATYADFYTAVLIAAPLFFVSVLSILALVGGEILGMSIPDAIGLGTYIFLPLLNTVFIAFVNYTQPNI